MSDLDTHPEVVDSRASGAADRTLTARKVWLGKTTEVARILPDRTVRMIGAWCFLDHYGPEDIGDSRGMLVPPRDVGQRPIELPRSTPPASGVGS